MTQIRVKREPLTYERGGANSRYSFFQDWAASEHRRDPAARSRLERHQAEMRTEIPAFEKRMATEAPDGVEYRVNPNRTDGQGGYFSPPLWLEEAFATAPRPARVLAGMIPNFDLPKSVSSVHLPRILTGADAEPGEDLEPAPRRDITDAAVESPATTIDGQVDVALQLLEQSPRGAHFDYAITRDLTEALDAKLEERLFVGTGVGRQFTGLLNLPTGAGAVSSVTITGTPKGYEVFTALGKVGGQLGDARKLPPEVWLMRTARWCWLGSSTDEEKLPLAVPGHQAIAPVAYTFDDSRPAVAPPILGFPNYLDDAIPATLGEEGDQDAIVAIRPTDFMLFESPTHTATLTEVLSGTMQVRFVVRRYASVLWRYPTGIAKLTGSGLTIPSEE